MDRGAVIHSVAKNNKTPLNDKPSSRPRTQDPVPWGWHPAFPGSAVWPVGRGGAGGTVPSQSDPERSGFSLNLLPSPSVQYPEALACPSDGKRKKSPLRSTAEFLEEQFFLLLFFLAARGFVFVTDGDVLNQGLAPSLSASLRNRSGFPPASTGLCGDRDPKGSR